MEKTLFYSYKPYLQLSLDREHIIVFDKECTYTAKTQTEAERLRRYAEDTKNSYNIIEAGGELGREDLIRLHEECVNKLIAEAEARENARAEAEKKEKELHDFYTLLRMSDRVCR